MTSEPVWLKIQSLECNVDLSTRVFTTSRLSLTSKPVRLKIQSLENNVRLSPRLFTTSRLTLTSESVKWLRPQSLESNVGLSSIIHDLAANLDS